MQNRNNMVIGSFLILLGGAWFVASMLRISFWAICFPVGLILLGALFLFARPPLFGPSSESGAHFVGDIVRSGEWPVKNEEFWLFVGDVRLDMTRAQFPLGETTIYLNAFVADIDLSVPSDVGVSLSTTSFVSEAELNGQHVERFLSGVQLSTPDYASAERKLRLVTTCFVSDVNVKMKPAPAAQAIVENGAPQPI
ncbi:MAG TPA: cell wall-active antibiotics response protein LiaF [Anaerolineae bacterium]|nr:cell wall-active antibiotics response protein LiaF [Anaerolineae bacterium]